MNWAAVSAGPSFEMTWNHVKRDELDNLTVQHFFNLFDAFDSTRFIEVKAYVGYSTLLIQLILILASNDLANESKVEKCPFCQKVIEARIQDGLADAGVIFDDITKVTGMEFGDDIDGYLAGFPCQAWSTSAVSAAICRFLLSLPRMCRGQGTKCRCWGHGQY